MRLAVFLGGAPFSATPEHSIYPRSQGCIAFIRVNSIRNRDQRIRGNPVQLGQAFCLDLRCADQTKTAEGKKNEPGEAEKFLARKH